MAFSGDVGALLAGVMGGMRAVSTKASVALFKPPRFESMQVHNIAGEGLVPVLLRSPPATARHRKCAIVQLAVPLFVATSMLCTVLDTLSAVMCKPCKSLAHVAARQVAPLAWRRRAVEESSGEAPHACSARAVAVGQDFTHERKRPVRMDAFGSLGAETSPLYDLIDNFQDTHQLLAIRMNSLRE